MNHIKRMRLALAIPIKTIANNIGISVEEYSSLETGRPKIKDELVAPLATSLRTKESIISGTSCDYDDTNILKHEIFNSKAKLHHTYYGDVALHFVSGGKLLLPVSPPNRIALEQQLHLLESKYLVIKSLDNRTVIVNKDNTTDVFITNAMHSERGLKNVDYPFTGPHSTSHEFWKTLEVIDRLETHETELDPKIVSIVRNCLSETSELSPLHKHSHLGFFAQAVKWQFANGVNRCINDYETAAMESIAQFIRDIGRSNESSSTNMERLNQDLSVIQFDSYKSSPLKGSSLGLIQTASLEYFSVPTHRLNESTWENTAKRIDH